MKSLKPGSAADPEVTIPDPPPGDDEGVGAPATSPTQSSRVIPLARSAVFLYLTVIFVAVNILLPRWPALGCHGLLVVFLVLLLVCSRKPDGFPEWFRTLQKNFVLQLRDNPPEISVVFGIVLLSLVNNIVLASEHYEILPRSRELLSVLVVVGAFVLNRRRQKYEFGRRSFWDYFKKGATSQVKVRKQVVEEPVHERPPSSESQVLKADQNRKRWEDRQKQRWEEWILEEVERLNDDRKK